MTAHDFAREFVAELKGVAVEPLFSMGELVLIFALVAYKPPWWFLAPVALTWIILRNTREAQGEETQND